MKKKLLALLVGSALSAPAWAIQPFVVKDIRVEGIQRTEAGTVFSYLPVKVGDTLDDEKAAAAIKALFATGFFKDVRLEVEGGVLVVMLQERPAISQIDLTGIKEFGVDELKKALKETGLAEGRIFDKSLLDKAEQELKRQYFSRGKYGATVTATVTPLERNRVAVSLNVEEGEVAKIRQINLVGNQVFEEKALLKLFSLTTPTWISWWTKSDQYSKQKLSADLEVLRSHYLNQGYLEFNIDSTQVSISPDKQDIYITINFTEGGKYKVSSIKLAGEMLIPEAELAKLVKLQPGDHFSRQKLNDSAKAINDRLGNEGYAFANVNAVPEVNKEKLEAGFTFFVDPGKRVYVRRINIGGNTRSRDEVLRREMRQLEGGWYAADKIARSRERLERLGYFSDINVETPAVAGTTDQVDMNVTVTEKPTGNIMLGAGYSSSEGFLTSGSVSQNNVFGSGKHVSAQFNSGKVNAVYSFSYTDPYYTVDGLSAGFDVYKRNVDSASLNVGTYSTSTWGGGIRMGIPTSEKNAIHLGLAYENTKITTDPSSPQRYIDYVAQFGNKNDLIRLDSAWASDSRDSLTYPTKGSFQRAYGELGMPGGDLKYYKLSYQHQYLRPVFDDMTVLLNGEIGVGGGYGGRPLPFFKNFFAGGVSSVRGFDSGTVGPRDRNDEGLGGTKRLVGNAELLFPMPGMGKDKSVRMAVFMDAGATFGPGDKNGNYAKVNLGDMRYSTGVGATWFSPMGPMRLSVAKPLNDKEGDKVQKLQFTMGSAF